ncbi:hypothetical protein nbrc107696_09930 [Gordonia spumicola]|uniref:DUF5642 domain-containing protein n=1 Tax=Gordonia spumicola TaxID=589161 RepID=A0A7I9V5L9_9ACTN|nr:hypothetical protein [Gordonia spumicola]GEE00547.1 hypothetical protein nbrc107696_09930 [Gordonia spumicola]
MSLKSRAAGSVLVGAALVGAVASCGKSEAVDPAVQHALDSVLTSSEFPAGYETVDLGKDENTAISDQLADSRRDAEVTPESCKSSADVPSAADTGSAVAVNGSSTLSQSVAVSDESGVGLAAAVSGECSTVTVRLTAGPAKGTTAVITSADVQSTSIGGFDGVTFRQVTRTDDVDRSMLIGRFQVNGYLVVVQAATADGSEPDRASFDQTVKAAVSKTAKA